MSIENHFKMIPLAALILLPLVASMDYPKGDLCRVFSNNTRISDPHSDLWYITCINHTSYFTECPETIPFYDKDAKVCVELLPEDSIAREECTNSTGKFVPDPTSCSGYYYCEDAETALFGKCPEGLHFNNAKQECVYKLDSPCTPEQFDYCDIISDQETVNIRDVSDCRRHFTCREGEFETNYCGYMEYYSAIRGECDHMSQVKCPNHPIPEYICGSEDYPIAGIYVSDERSCNGYYYCEERYNGVFPVWGECPPNKFFDSGLQLCVKPSDMYCMYDRCIGQTKPFVTSSTTGCRNYLRCVDGKTWGPEMSCGNKFFDEDMGACVSSVIQYLACEY